MNIAFVSNVVYPFVKGGAEKRIHEIGTRLARKGHDVTVYCRQYWEGSPEISYEGMTLRAVAPKHELYENGRRSITEALEFSVHLLSPLRQNIDKHDVIVASVFPYFPVLTSKLTTLGADTPLITTWHEVWCDYWDEYLGYLAPFGKATERLTAKMPHYPIAVSGVTADRLAKIGLPREQITVVPNGINIDQLQSITPAEQGFEVLFAGRLISDKNVNLLINAFNHIADDYNVTLGIIGDGPERERLQALTASLKHNNRIRFTGFLDDYEDVLAHMHAAEIFVSPSTREGFGITYVEAMAADCVVIGANHPESAANEVINDAGFLTEPTVDSLAATLDRVLKGNQPQEDPKRRAAQYDWDQIAIQAERAYLSTIESSQELSGNAI